MSIELSTVFKFLGGRFVMFGAKAYLADGVDALMNELDEALGDGATVPRDAFKQAFNAAPTRMDSAVAWFRHRNRRAFTIAGPSGAGKSTLLASLDEKLTYDNLPTSEPKDSYIVVARRRTKVRDLPGKRSHGTAEHPGRLVAEDPPAVLILVFAGGYLHTAQDVPLHRGPISHGPLTDYIKACRREELTWFQHFVGEFKKYSKIGASPIRDVVIAVNKMDIWGDNSGEIEELYESDEFVSLLDDLLSTDMFVAPARTRVTRFRTAASHNSFVVPTEHRQLMSSEMSHTTTVFFRALISSTLAKHAK